MARLEGMELWEAILEPVVGFLETELELLIALGPAFAVMPHETITEIETALTNFQIEIAEKAYSLGLAHGAKTAQPQSQP